MSDLAQSFLERWTEENVTVIPAVEHEAEAERLATVCKEEAAQEGITEADLNEACSQSSDEEHPDVLSFMQAALETAAAAEDDSDVDEDEEEDA